MKPRQMRRVRHVARTEDITNALTILVENHEGTGSFRRRRPVWADNIKNGLKRIRHEDMDLVQKFADMV